MPAASRRPITQLHREWTTGHGPAARGRGPAFARQPQTTGHLKLYLLGQITRLEQDLTVLRGRLQTLEAANETVEEPPPLRRRNLTPRPALAPLILSLLPQAGTLCPIDDIISGMLTAEQVAVDDRPARSKAYRRANLCLHKLRTEGSVISHRIGNGRLDWGLNLAEPLQGDQGDHACG
jgi:hypothetical protein